MSRQQLIDLPGEIWKDITGFNALYQISNLGRISRLRLNNVRYIIKQGTDERGYKQINLRTNFFTRATKVHILVAEAFIPNPENKKTVNHKNTVKDDNRVENLEWMTSAENLKHGRDNGCFAGVGKVVLQYDLQDNFIKEWSSTMEIQRQLGIANTQISQACLAPYGQRKPRKFKWRYKYEGSYS